MNDVSLNASRAIGDILVEMGRLTPADIERILHTQREQGLRFGETAIKLRLLSAQDVQDALSRQFDFPCVFGDKAEVSDEIAAARAPFTPKVEALRALRSQLMARWFTGERERRTLAVVSAGRSEGRSYLAANLAVVFAQLGERTLLIDADMRHPRQHALFKLDNASGLSSVLAGRGLHNDIRGVPSFRELSILCAGPLPPNPQELLGRAPFARLLDMVAEEFDVVLVDTPAAKAYADVQTIALRTRGVLLVARMRETRIADLQEVATDLAQTGVKIAGSVLNEAAVVPAAKATKAARAAKAGRH